MLIYLQGDADCLMLFQCFVPIPVLTCVLSQLHILGSRQSLSCFGIWFSDCIEAALVFDRAASGLALQRNTLASLFVEMFSLAIHSVDTISPKRVLK